MSLSIEKQVEVLLPCLEKCDGKQGALFDDSNHKRNCPAYYREGVAKTWEAWAKRYASAQGDKHGL